MEIITTKLLDGLAILQPKLHQDGRGYFFESFHEEKFKANIADINFVQDNQSLSQKGVLRGMHFQNPPHEQAKLVRVIKGAVLDVVVDIRRNSSTYGEWYAIELNEENNTQLFVPAGFAHGFQTLSDNTIFSYKCSNYYSKESEGAIPWNDPTLNINWRDLPVSVSPKDSAIQPFDKFNSLF